MERRAWEQKRERKRETHDTHKNEFFSVKKQLMKETRKHAHQFIANISISSMTNFFPRLVGFILTVFFLMRFFSFHFFLLRHWVARGIAHTCDAFIDRPSENSWFTIPILLFSFFFYLSLSLSHARARLQLIHFGSFAITRSRLYFSRCGYTQTIFFGLQFSVYV